MAYSKQNFQDGQILNAANLEAMENGIIAGQGAKNLLDNSNFRDPVNQRGIYDTTESENLRYTIDRWISYLTSIDVDQTGMLLSGQFGSNYNTIYQYVPLTPDGRIYTAALYYADGTVKCASGDFLTKAGGVGAEYGVLLEKDSDGKPYVQLYTYDGKRIIGAALYEGSYTADTLPSYVPKGKHVEMLNCGIPLYPKNLLKNSDFTNPSNVNRGMTSYSGAFYDIIDLWDCATPNGSTTTTELTSNGLKFTHSDGSSMIYLRQNVSDFWKNNKVYTIGGYKDDGTFFYSGYYNSGDGKINIVIPSGTTVASVVCYEGKYTEDMLPPYVPKGKHVEMLNCNVPLAPRNLLDNSNFNDPINSRGKTSYSGNQYTIDRWYFYDSGENGTFVINNGYVSLTGGSGAVSLSYRFPKGFLNANKKYTAVICDNLGNINTAGLYFHDDFDSFEFSAGAGGTKNVAWAALYEGAYTADALPAYVPKGKHVEMLNCNIPLTPHNLLDNSDFRSPVNQRGIASGAVITGWDYFIDRWQARAENCSVNFSGEGITASTPIGQILPKETVKNGMTVTAAAKWSDGTICVASGAIRRTNEWGSFSSANINGHSLYVSDEGDGNHACITISEGTVVWAALYEGSYDASTLPVYQPKGYAAELAECQRYYRTMPYPVIPCGNNPAGTQVYGFLPFRMRIANPTVSYDTLYFFKGDTTFVSVSSASAASYGAGTRIVFNLSSNVEGNLAGAVAGNGITLNANL